MTLAKSATYDAASLPAIGGVFASCDVSEPVEDSLWARWTKGAAAAYGFRNARSALWYILDQKRPRTFWLPAYCCPEVASAAQAAKVSVAFYRLGPDLQPDLGDLAPHLEAGDVVLGVNHFGRPAEALRPLAAARRDVTWIEDCAQAMDTAVPPWAPLRLFSPRKLAGVPDGGLLVDEEGQLAPPGLRRRSDARLRHAGLLRRRDVGDRDNARWFDAFRKAEAAMTVEAVAMSPVTVKGLKGTAAEPALRARRYNYEVLRRELGALAFFPEPRPDWVPMGYVIRVEDAAAVGAQLAANRIFAPRHWARLAMSEPPALERSLSRQLLTLPCDQRYGEADMMRIVRTVRKGQGTA